MSDTLEESAQVSLQVGEQWFTTTAETLTKESSFFSSLLSGRWDDNVQADGSYFIDADPRLFEHILRYLRRGVLPVFYDPIRGHDHALCLSLLEEARYFQIPRLVQWLENKNYLQAVKMEYLVKTVEGNHVEETVGTDAVIECRPSWITRKVYLCPDRDRSHHGSYYSCKYDLNNSKPLQYEEVTTLQTIVIRRQMDFDEGICLSGR